MSAIKVTAADKYFSMCVRERSDWRCERCGIELRHEPHRLHCSHVFSRRWASVRHEPLNALALCAGCHRTVSENPPDHVDLYLSIHGRERYELLRELKERIVPKRDRPDKEIARHLRNEWLRLIQIRHDGKTGRIDFVGWL
jgi:cytochrome c553